MSLAKKIYRKIRYPVNDLLYSTGLEKTLLKNRPGKRILAYHGVDAVGSLAYNSRFISEHSFEQQVNYFKNHFQVVSLKDYYDQELPTDKLTIALTFDDGYANNFTRVLPILEKYQVPATFFITAIRAMGYAYLWNDFYDMLRHKVQTVEYKGITYKRNRHNQFISQQFADPLHVHLRKLPFAEIGSFMKETESRMGFKLDSFPADYHLQLTEKQIQTMAQSPLVTIGSHSTTHIDMIQRPIEEVIEEMKFSKEWLEKITGKVVDSFAFPYGCYTPEVVESAKELGFRYILPVTFTNESDDQIPELRSRFGNNPFISVKNQIWCILNERYL